MASNQPIIKQIAWLSILPQLIVMITIFVICKLSGTSDPIFSGAILYLIILITLRIVVPRNHRRGISLFKKKEFAAAKDEFIKSYEFFRKNSWIDKYRYLTLLSSSRISYREMALLNTAYCYGQIGEGHKSKEYYEKTLSEFPGSEIAIASLNMIKAAQKVPTSKSGD